MIFVKMDVYSYILTDVGKEKLLREVTNLIYFLYFLGFFQDIDPLSVQNPTTIFIGTVEQQNINEIPQKLSQY